MGSQSMCDFQLIYNKKVKSSQLNIAVFIEEY